MKIIIQHWGQKFFAHFYRSSSATRSSEWRHASKHNKRVPCVHYLAPHNHNPLLIDLYSNDKYTIIINDTRCFSLCIFLPKSRKRSQQLKQHKKGINEYENKIIRFYYCQAYFSVLFNTSYYIIIITPLHSVRFACISFAFLCLLHLVYKKQQPKMSLYIIINFTSLPSLFYCYIFSYIFLQSTPILPHT